MLLLALIHPSPFGCSSVSHPEVDNASNATVVSSASTNDVHCLSGHLHSDLLRACGVQTLKLVASASCSNKTFITFDSPYNGNM